MYTLVPLSPGPSKACIQGSLASFLTWMLVASALTVGQRHQFLISGPPCRAAHSLGAGFPPSKREPVSLQPNLGNDTPLLPSSVFVRSPLKSPAHTQESPGTLQRGYDASLGEAASNPPPRELHFLTQSWKTVHLGRGCSAIPLPPLGSALRTSGNRQTKGNTPRCFPLPGSFHLISAQRLSTEQPPRSRDGTWQCRLS